MDIYLDNNATSMLTPLVREQAVRLLGQDLGNPASPHSWGNNAGRHLAQTRAVLSESFGVEETKFLFTSGGSEANTTILRSFARRHGRSAKFVTTAVEHSSILSTVRQLEAEGHAVVILPVDREGLVCASDLAYAVGTGPTLVSIQWVNNETGVIQDIPTLLEETHALGGELHVDAAQAVGKIPINLLRTPLDFLTLTGHKFHAPQGVGALYSRSPKLLAPLIGGGAQEGGLRPGTPNTLGIALLGTALSERLENFEQKVEYLRRLRDNFEERVLEGCHGSQVNGRVAARVPNTSNLRFPNLDGRALVAQLDMAGVICSQASACTSAIPEPSHVLVAMGLTEDEAWGSVRFSFSVLNTVAEAMRAADTVVTTATKLIQSEDTSSIAW